MESVSRDGKLPGVGWKPTRGHKDWLTVRDVVELLEIHPDTVRRWIRTGKLPGKFFGGSMGYRIRRADLRGLLRPTPARVPKTVETPASSQSRTPKEVQV